jgi:hypothetical protein
MADIHTKRADPRDRLAFVLGAWWRGHGPRGKALFGALLLPTRAPETSGPDAATAISAGVVVDVVCAGTGEVMRRGYILPTTGYAWQVAKALRPLLPAAVAAGSALRLFCGHGGRELHPQARMNTCAWPGDWDRELVVMPWAPFRGNVDDSTATIIIAVAVHPASSAIAVYGRNHAHARQMELLSLRGGSQRRIAGWRVRAIVLGMQFSRDGSVLVTVHEHAVRFASATTGQVLRIAPLTDRAHGTRRQMLPSVCDRMLTAIASAATASGDMLRATDTLVCLVGRWVWYTVVVARREQQTPYDPREQRTPHPCTVASHKARGRGRLVWSDAVVLSSGDGVPETGPAVGPAIGVATIAQLPPSGGTATATATIHLVCLQTGESVQRLLKVSGKARIWPSTDDSQSFWLADGRALTRMRRTAPRTVVRMEHVVVGHIDPLARVFQVPCRQPPVFVICMDSHADVTVARTRHRLAGKEAWPLSDGVRVLHKFKHDSGAVCDKLVVKDIRDIWV